jgi:hypothetical protein
VENFTVYPYFRDTVLWEGKGAIPLLYPIGGNLPTIEKLLSFLANGRFSKLALLLVKTSFSNGVLEPLAQST